MSVGRFIRRALPLVLPAVLLIGAGTGARGIDLNVPVLGALSLHGYYKNFFLSMDSSEPFIGDGEEDLNRARLMLEGRLSRRVDFALHYEHMATINPIGAGSALFLGSAGGRDRPGVQDFSWSIRTDNDVRWRHEIDRVFVRSRQPWGDVIVGRQAVGWGVGMIWSPQDLFLAFSPVEIDREFRTGIDAARVIVPFGTFTEAELVYAVFDEDVDEHTAAVRWRTTLSESSFDLGFMAGKFFDDAVVGGLLAGEIGGVGVHAEVTATHNYGGGNERVGRQDFARAVVGADYRFPGEVYVIGEYYFNGFGESDAERYANIVSSPRLRRGEIFNPGRHYLGFIADWEAHPLVHLSAQGQWNMLDPSALVGPAASISLSDEAQLDSGVYFALGEGFSGPTPGSELGSAPDVYYVTAKIYF